MQACQLLSRKLNSNSDTPLAFLVLQELDDMEDLEPFYRLLTEVGTAVIRNAVTAASR